MSDFTAQPRKILEVLLHPREEMAAAISLCSFTDCDVYSSYWWLNLEGHCTDRVAEKPEHGILIPSCFHHAPFAPRKWSRWWSVPCVFHWGCCSERNLGVNVIPTTQSTAFDHSRNCCGGRFLGFLNPLNPFQIQTHWPFAIILTELLIYTIWLLLARCVIMGGPC